MAVFFSVLHSGRYIQNGCTQQSLFSKQNYLCLMNINRQAYKTGRWKRVHIFSVLKPVYIFIFGPLEGKMAVNMKMVFQGILMTRTTTAVRTGNMESVLQGIITNHFVLRRIHIEGVLKGVLLCFSMSKRNLGWFQTVSCCQHLAEHDASICRSCILCINDKTVTEVKSSILSPRMGLFL